MTSFMGRGRADTNILAGRLMNLGLDETQIKGLVNQILARAEGAVGAEGAAKIRAILPALDERFDQKDGSAHAGASGATPKLKATLARRDAAKSPRHVGPA
jgi:hypothetical protein